LEESRNPIPTPWPLIARRVRYQILPVLTLVLSVVLAGWLWYRRGGSPTAIGSVFAYTVDVNPKIDGLLVDLPRTVQLFDSVSAGEVIARLDSSLLLAQIDRTTKELTEVRRQLEMINNHRGRRTPTTAPVTTTPDSAAPIRAPINPRESAVADAPDITGLIQSEYTLRMLHSTLEARLAELEQRVLLQDIKAPISGTIIAISRFPGQAVTAGQPIIKIAAEKGDFIVTYIRQSQYIQPVPGMTVNVHLRSAPRTFQSHIKSVGPQLELIPDIHLRDPRYPEWGLPVHIAIPHDPLRPSETLKLRPGELVDLFFRPKSVASAGI
jgi:multidrug resistance efflux pump